MAIPPGFISGWPSETIGDSISSHANIKVIEDATKTKIVASKAYGAVHDSVSNVAKDASFYPKKNFTDVIPHEVTKDKFEHLILQAGSVDQAENENAEIHLECFKHETICSANNIF